MKVPQRSVAENDRSSIPAVVRGNSEFALDLYHALRTREGNLSFSPYSISTALAMTYAGARGRTESQMAETLHFALDQPRLHAAMAALGARLKSIPGQGCIQLRIANALWPQAGYPFLDDFLALTDTYYGVQTTAVDYHDPETARQQINAWVAARTEDRIQDLIPAGILGPLTSLVLTNAIYFKGHWDSPFESERTRMAPFRISTSERMDVPTMTQEHRLGYWEGDGLQVLELPYVGGDLAMIVLLPKVVGGLSGLEMDLTVANLGKWTEKLVPTRVQVALPKFRISQDFRLDDALKAMGMREAFEGRKADFSGMDGNENRLSIAAVLHQAFIDVNEEGTEAAAATAVVMSRGISEAKLFRADHAFVYLIREKGTGSILFLGRVVEPTTGAT